MCGDGPRAESADFGAAGGSGSVTVSTNGDTCEWSATSDAAWLVITSGSTGSGSSGTIEYSVAVNEIAAARSATITVAGFTHVVQQAAAACEVLGISPLSAEIEADGGSGLIEVSTNGDACGWTATSDVPWLTITSGASGSGFTGEIAYSVAENPDAVSRIGVITVSGYTHIVSQAPRVNVPGDFDTINEALSNVPDGTTIVIEPGTYPGPIDLTGRSVVLEGAEGAEVIIDGSAGDGPAIIVTAPAGVAEGGTSVFRFLTIRGGSNGTVVPPFDTPVGGGVLVVGADVIIEDCKIVENASANGAGLAAIGASIELNRVEFRDNAGTEFGGGLLLRDSDAVLIDVVVAGNSATLRGGGIDAQGGTLMLVGVLIEENETGGEGGGIAWGGGSRPRRCGVHDLEQRHRLERRRVGRRALDRAGRRRRADRVERRLQQRARRDRRRVRRRRRQRRLRRLLRRSHRRRRDRRRGPERPAGLLGSLRTRPMRGGRSDRRRADRRRRSLGASRRMGRLRAVTPVAVV